MSRLYTRFRSNRPYDPARIYEAFENQAIDAWNRQKAKGTALEPREQFISHYISRAIETNFGGRVHV